MNKPRKPRIAPPAKGPPQAVQRAKIIRVITERLKQFDFDDLVYIARLTAAFSALYERYQGPIYRFALHMSGNSAIAEEITQEVFMVVIANMKGYDATRGSLAGYLFGIARNLTRRSLEQNRFQSPMTEELCEAGNNEPASDLDVLADVHVRRAGVM